MDTAPTGLARRRPRLSDAETAERTLAAAVALVERSGLTVSLDHISFEDVIREAGVSRSAAYRRWPYKDLFFSDLLKQLATAATPDALSRDESTQRALARIVLDRADDLRSPDGRRALVAELFREGARRDFETMHGSTEWRTYLALHATFLSLADGHLRDDVQAALAESERGFVARIAAAYDETAELLGYRLRPELGASFETVAGLASATLRGLVIMALSTPEVADLRLHAAPFGGSDRAEWSLAGVGLASIAFTFLEPDPGIVWGGARVAEVVRLVRDLGSA